MKPFAVGDLITFHIWDEFHKKYDKIQQGTIIRLDDGTKRKMPGELMYVVHVEGGGEISLHGHEIIGRLNSKKQMKKMAKELHVKRSKVVSKVFSRGTCGKVTKTSRGSKQHK